MIPSFDFLKIVPLVAASSLLVSCGAMNTLKTSATTGMGKMGEGIGSGFEKVADITTSPFRPAVPVVEAREDDLKPLESGQDKALAYQRSSGFWSFFGGPVDFEEPNLPDEGGAIDGGLLPPIE